MKTGPVDWQVKTDKERKSEPQSDCISDLQGRKRGTVDTDDNLAGAQVAHLLMINFTGDGTIFLAVESAPQVIPSSRAKSSLFIDSPKCSAR